TFNAVVGGMGLLGAITRVKLKLKPMNSGRLRVKCLTARNIDEQFDLCEAHLGQSDYLVSWVDCMSDGESLGRGQIHAANYLEPGEDPLGASTFHVENQILPSRILGVPKSALWRIMKYFMNDPGTRLVNGLKYLSSKRQHGKSYLQSHVGFAFLLDYVPNWRLAYGSNGFIQYQIFVPDGKARSCFRDVLRISHEAGLRPYLGVLKRHRPDGFLMTHALDGWSFALDFKVPKGGRVPLWEHTDRLTDRVLAAGGKFYFAKDAVLTPDQVLQAYGPDAIRQFFELKQVHDPSNLLTNDLWERAIRPLEEAVFNRLGEDGGALLPSAASAEAAT
ncbi:MAG: FAD-binding oxidoreductase, partial [Myxococcales bacterium]|nr:FAD-binding oxidoreductase [Myxococcales bacterium]